jgi:type VI secretion system protein ImpG
MGMSVNAYYRDELTYLKETAELFAKSNPKLSRFLDRSASDPDVERLMEGFAFLVGRLRQRLDAEMPELTNSLLRLIWPHCLRPVPPITTVQFGFAPGTTNSHIDVPRGTRVQSEPVGGQAVTFSTSYDLTVLPFEIAAVELENRIDSCVLNLRIKRICGSDLRALASAPLQLFINGHGDPQLARNMYMFLLERVKRVRVAPFGGTARTVPLAIVPLGFEENESTLLGADDLLGGFRIMQEYFCCPEKFMHLRLNGLQAVADQQAAGFSVSFEMDRHFPATGQLSNDMFAFNATPAVNMFAADGQALMISHDRHEYPVRAASGGPVRSVQAVKSVTGWVQGTGRRVDYRPFESFEHMALDEASPNNYYRTHLRPAVLGNGVEHTISFLPSGSGMPATETVSLELVCSDGERASNLRIGDVNHPTSSTPAKLEIANITPVLSEVPPPINDEIQWTLVANLARNFASLVDVDALRTVLRVHDFRANVDRQAAQQRDLLLRSFKRFERKGVDLFNRGRPVRAFELTLTVSEDLMGGEGEMYFFGTFLDRFLKSYAGINSLHQFAIRGLDTNVYHRWSPKWGDAPTL